MACGHNTTKALNVKNNIRLRNSRYKVSEKYQKQQQKLRAKRKNKENDDNLYILGSFSSNITPDNMPPAKKPKKNTKHNKAKENRQVQITFVNENDIKFLLSV